MAVPLPVTTVVVGPSQQHFQSTLCSVLKTANFCFKFTPSIRRGWPRHLRKPFFSRHCLCSSPGLPLDWTMGWPVCRPWVGCPGPNSTAKPIADGIPSVASMSSCTKCVGTKGNAMIFTTQFHSGHGGPDGSGWFFGSRLQVCAH